MKKWILLLVGVMLSHGLFAQSVSKYVVIDKKALAVPVSLTTTTDNLAKYFTTNFPADSERARAIFVWVASNLEYDIENMYDVDLNSDPAGKIEKTLRSRKGICINYALLFEEIAKKSGLNAVVIEGYTRQAGTTELIPHAWNAVFVSNEWILLDATWASGHVNKGKYFKNFNDSFYDVEPSTLIKSHMPHDYIWQMLAFPITTKAFLDKNYTAEKGKKPFDFKQVIFDYQQLDQIEKYTASAARLKENGISNRNSADRMRYLTNAIENDKHAKVVNLYNQSVAMYNDGIIDFNAFIAYRNKQFSPLLPDSEIKKMLDDPREKLMLTKKKLSEIKSQDASTISAVRQLSASIDEALKSIYEQQEWLTIYFTKSKSARRNSFFDRKMTVFGIPVK